MSHTAGAGKNHVKKSGGSNKPSCIKVTDENKENVEIPSFNLDYELDTVDISGIRIVQAMDTSGFKTVELMDSSVPEVAEEAAECVKDFPQLTLDESILVEELHSLDDSHSYPMSEALRR